MGQFHGNAVAAHEALVVWPWLCHGLSWALMALPYGTFMILPMAMASPLQCHESPWQYHGRHRDNMRVYGKLEASPWQTHGSAMKAHYSHPMPVPVME